MMVSELKWIGKLLSIFILLVLYGVGWMITIAFFKGEADDTCSYGITVLNITAHIIVLGLFMLWSWF